MEWSRLIQIKWFVRFKEREQVTKKNDNDNKNY